jgi:S-adenosylmethionine hydrolase
MPIIGYITDFGERGLHYVAQMKAVALNINPTLQFLDISHSITPFSIIEAAYILHTTLPILPPSAIVVCVVDPGVGSHRDILAIKLKSGQIVIGPDNGIFTYLVLHHHIETAICITESEFFYTPPELASPIAPLSNQSDKPDEPKTAQEPKQRKLSIIEEDLLKMIAPAALESPHLASTEKIISATFHGRDIMSPIAAHLSKGLDIFALGNPKDEEDILQIPELDPDYRPDEYILGAIVQYIDNFGNIITTIPSHQFDTLTGPTHSLFILRWKGEKIPVKRSPTFAGNDPDIYLLIEGSSGFLEICINRSNAAKALGASLGQDFELELGGSDIQFGSELNVPPA